MAEASVDHIIVDDFLTCQICFEIYQEPKILKCLHSFCENCLAKCITKRKSEEIITCPLCRDISDLSQNGLTSLKSNFYIKNLIDFLNTTSNINQCQWQCSYCEISKRGRVNAAAKCLSCNDFLCQTCADNHNGTRMTLGHQVASIDDLNSGKYNSQVRSKQEIPCSKHVEEIIRYQCESCNIPVCRDCVLLDHRQHECVQITEAIKTRQNEIAETLKSLDKRLDNMENSKRSFEKKLEELSAKELSYIEKVQRTTEVLIQNARKESEMTKRLIKEQFKGSTKYLQDSKTAMETKAKDLGDSLKFCRTVINDGKDAEILFLLETMKERLTKLQLVEDDKEHLRCQIEEPSLQISEIFLGEDPPKLFLVQCPTKSAHTNDQIYFANSKDNDEKSLICKEQNDNKEKGSPKVKTVLPTLKTVSDCTLKQPRTDGTQFKLKWVRNIDRIQMTEKWSSNLTCLCRGKNNTFYTVDCNNSKLTQYSTSGDYITSISIKNAMSAAQCESFLACGSLDGKISTIRENGTISDTDIPILNWTFPMCSTRDNRSIMVITTDRFFRITERTIDEIILKRRGSSCRISPMSLSNFKSSQYIVSDMKSSSLLFIDENGTIFKDYRHTDQHWTPGATTTDSLDYIYTICYHQCSLQILNPEAIHMQTIYLKPYVSEPRNVSVVEDRRIVISSRNGITIFDIDCVSK